jgi:taurine dioxygenase
VIDVHPLEPFGAELQIDLRAPLSTEQEVELLRLYHEYDLLVIRRQELSIDDQIRVMGYLGPVMHTPDGVGQIRPDNGLRTSRLAFHSDLAFSPEPVLGISLHALEVIDGRTATRFANARHAYERLDPTLRRRLAGREALHVFALDLGGRNRAEAVDPRLPSSVHPVIWNHPETGAPLVYVSENQTDAIVGVDSDESEAALSLLFHALYQPSDILEHRWRNGDIVIWDNLSVQHGRADISDDGPRILQRVALGTKGLAEQHPELADYYG